MLNGIKDYLHDQIALVKLDGVEAIGRVASRILFITLIISFAMFFLLLLSLAGGFYLARYFENDAFGFLTMAGVYLVLIVLALVFKKQIQSLLLDLTIDASFTNDDDDED